MPHKHSLPKTGRGVRDEDGFSLVEMILAMIILSILVLISGPTFYSQEDNVRDFEPKSTVLEVHDEVKLIWVENDHVYPSTSDLLLMLTPGEPAFTHRAELPDTSFSINPADVSLRVEDDSIITICARSRTETVYCARFDERSSLAIASTDSGSLLALASKSAGDALLPHVAYAQEGEEEPDVYNPSERVSYAHGTGVSAEQDAIAALAGDVEPPTCLAGPGNTGMPTWEVTVDCDTPEPDDPPVVEITSGPPDPDTNLSPEIVWSNNTGGPVTEEECTLDGAPLSCVSPSVNLSNLTLGGHTFAITAHGPGGTDTVSHTWSIINPPNDRIDFDGDMDYAGVFVPPGLRPTGAFEVGSWVKFNNLSRNQTIMSGGCTHSNGNPCDTHSGWSLQIMADGSVHFIVMATNGQRYSEDHKIGQPYNCVANEGGSAAPVTTGNWHYVSAHYDPNGRIRVYLNNRVQDCSSNLGGRNPMVNDDMLYIGTEINQGDTGWQNYIEASQIAVVRMTRGGGPAFVVNPGPSATPGRLYSPAENDRPATFLFDFENDLADSTGNLGSLTLYGNAELVGP